MISQPYLAAVATRVARDGRRLLSSQQPEYSGRDLTASGRRWAHGGPALGECRALGRVARHLGTRLRASRAGRGRHQTGDPERAARLFGAAEALYEASSVTPSFPPTQALYERDLESAREQLDTNRFAAAWAEGRTMSPEGAVAEALAE